MQILLTVYYLVQLGQCCTLERFRAHENVIFHFVVVTFNGHWRADWHCVIEEVRRYIHLKLQIGDY